MHQAAAPLFGIYATFCKFGDLSFKFGEWKAEQQQTELTSIATLSQRSFRIFRT